ATWSAWGGLNDFYRHTESAFGNTANRYGFAGPGGFTNISANAGDFRRGLRAAYSAGNRIFRHRFSYSQSTGMRRSGWAFTGATSVRTGDQVSVPGTYFNAWSAYVSVQRRLNYRHQIALSAFV